VKQKTEDACGEEKGCSWCKTGGVGTGCYPEKVAKKLPEKFFECDIEQTPEDDVSAVQMEAKVEETKAAVSPLNCMAKETADACDESDACNWCQSSGLGTGCYPKRVSKILPRKYFQCDKEVPKLSLADPKCEKKSEDDCTAPSCVWCTSAAVGGGCYSPEEAAKLPHAVFSCKTSPSTFATA